MSSSSRLSTVVSRRTAIQGVAGGVAATSLAAIAPPSGLARQQATPAAADDITPDMVQRGIDAIDGIAADAMDRTGVPGVSVAVVYQDEVLLTRGYGVASTETSAPVDADTIFQIASLSKPIASTIVAGIVGDGAVSWDTKIVDHLPEFALHEPWPTSQVTIRDMFSHRSGLADHAGDALEDMGYDRDTVLHRLRYLRPEYSFRAGYAYTNFGLTAGAVAASNAAGQAWEDAADSVLYQPAGMTRTSSRFDDFINADNHAAGHVEIDGAWVPKYVRDADAQSPAGGVSSTATDMARWLRLQLGGGTLDGTEIIPADALAETHRVQVIRTTVNDPSVDRAGFYGLGWNVSYDDHGAVQLSHSGAFGLGTGTAVYMYPAEGLGIAVLTNGAANGVAESIALGFLDVARLGSVQNDYVAIFGPIFAADMLPGYVTDVDYSTPPADALPPMDLSSYTGTWHNTFFGPIEIAADGDTLTLSQGPADDPDTYSLAHWDRDIFVYTPVGENENHPAAVTFTIGPDGVASAMTVENLNLEHQGTFTRDEATAP
jgi:CubicO group peptidase (beta-lactamase class C family)